MNETGINVKLGGAYSSTMLGGGITLLAVSGIINATSPEMSDKLFIVGTILIALSWIVYFLRWTYSHWLTKKKLGIR